MLRMKLSWLSSVTHRGAILHEICIEIICINIVALLHWRQVSVDGNNLHSLFGWFAYRRGNKKTVRFTIENCQEWGKKKQTFSLLCHWCCSWGFNLGLKKQIVSINFPALVTLHYKTLQKCMYIILSITTIYSYKKIILQKCFSHCNCITVNVFV